MNLRDLKYLVTVADLRSFSKAADACFISQPTLSGQIKKLEETLEIQVFERTNKKVMLTDIGEEIIKSARRILREVDTIYEYANNAKDPLAGRFRLGAFPTLSTYIFPTIVPRIGVELPNLRLILIEDKTANLIEKLRNGDLDAALLALPIHEDFLVSRKLIDDDFYLAVPENHELASKSSIKESELNGHKLLLLEEGHCLRDQSLEICHTAGIQENQDFMATGLETLRQMVKAGSGITFMPKIAIAENDQGIQYIPFKTPAPKRTIGIVWRKSSARTAVIDKIIRIINDLY